MVIVDAMAEIQILNNTCQTSYQLSNVIANHFLNKYKEYLEIHIVFDTYNDVSFKNALREKIQGGVSPTYYGIFNSQDSKMSKVLGIEIKKILSHSKTKGEFIIFVSNLIHKIALITKINVVISYDDTSEQNLH